MVDALNPTELLFSYGTLRDEKVQRAVFGRLLEGVPDGIVGYRLSPIQIDDPKSVAISGLSVHHVLQPDVDGDPIEGLVFRVTPEDIEQADRYEPAQCKRLRVRLRSGTTAWIYR